MFANQKPEAAKVLGVRNHGEACEVNAGFHYAADAVFLGHTDEDYVANRSWRWMEGDAG